MTFRPDPSGIAICNRALSRLKQGPISDLDPPTPVGVPSRECARWYKPVVARLLESHHWNLATRRVALTEATNDRTSDWRYRYALPVDVAFPVSLALPAGTTSNLQYYQGLAGLLATASGRPVFLKSGAFLYTTWAGDLDYVSYDISEADFNATFENIVELMLAAAMAYAITGSRTREESLRQQATSAMNLAIAQNLNAGNPRYGEFTSERDLARGASYSTPWDWWPGPS